jgi:hypothetical protein
MLRYQLVHDSKLSPTVTLQYLEEEFYTGKQVTEIPTEDDMTTFLTQVFTVGEFDREPQEFVSITVLIYVNRILSQTGIHLTPGNWKALFIGMLCIAQKFQDDKPLINADFCILYPVLKPLDVGSIERKILSLLKWKLTVSWPCFCQYYFELRTVLLERERNQRHEAVPTPRIGVRAELQIYQKNKTQFRARSMTREDVRSSHTRLCIS